MFFLCLLTISFSALAFIIVIFHDFIDANVNPLKGPVVIFLFPIYPIIRIIFLKMEFNNNIEINKSEEIIKLLAYSYFLIVIAFKFFSIDRRISAARFLTFTPFSFYSTYSYKSIIKKVIENVILFVPLGILLPSLDRKSVV